MVTIVGWNHEDQLLNVGHIIGPISRANELLRLDSHNIPEVSTVLVALLNDAKTKKAN